MVKQSTGILNPFVEKAPPPPSAPTVDNYGMEDEAYLHPKPTLDLDGDSYVIRFTNGIAADTVADALIELLYAVNAQAKTHLETHGVWVGLSPPEKDHWVSLSRPSVVIHVLADNEIQAFRLIGATLWSLDNKTVLTQHGVKLIKRG